MGTLKGARLKDSVVIFDWLQHCHERLHGQLRELRRRPVGDAKARQQKGEVSAQMLLLREAGRFILGADPEDNGNPFGGPEDY